ncbi:MAG: DUF922 domain-containing protein [Chitinophagales bacterium]
MRYFLSILVITLCLAAKPALFEEPAQTTIEWGKYHLLKWSDFKGVPENNSYFSAVSALYLQESHACDRYNGFEFEIKAMFDKEGSWSRNKKSLKLLRHEQLHFDLTEFYARKLRKRFEALENACMLPEYRIQEVVDEVFYDMVKAHESYDKMTKHGLVREEQEHWRIFVRERLNELDHYASAQYR